MTKFIKYIAECTYANERNDYFLQYYTHEGISTTT